MFVKLRKKIFNSIFLIVLAFVLITSAVSYATIVGYIYNSQRQRTVKNAQSGVVGCQNYLDAVMGFVSNTCAKQEVVDALQGNSAEIAHSLDDLCNNYVRIDGVILYGTNGYVAYSAGTGSVPSLNALSEVSEIKQFLNSSQKSFISVRKQAISQVYNKTFYNSRQGIVSCLHKVYAADGTLLGILEADILPQTLYNAKLGYSSFGATSQGFFVNDEGLFAATDVFSDYNVKSDTATSDMKYFSVRVAFDERTDVVLFVPLAEFIKRAVVLFFVFFAIDVVLVCVGAIVAFAVRDSVLAPLGKLLDKMNSVGNNF